MSTPDSAQVVQRLRAAGCVWAEEEAALLLEAAVGPALESLVVRRVAGEPIEVLLGWADLCGVRVGVRAGVFVPRQRSALLVRLGLELLATRGPSPVVVDLCCGTGALGQVLSTLHGPLDLHAADVDPVATACAAQNLAGAHVHTGDLFDALPPSLVGRVDLLVVNAPYVPSDRVLDMPSEARDHEPRHTLDGGDDGLDLHRRVADGAARWLAPGASLLLETSRGQVAGTLAVVRGGGLDAEVVADDDLMATVVHGRRRAPTARTPPAAAARPR